MPITDESLISQYSIIHASKRYGQASHDFALQIQICLLDLKPRSTLEYGCGQSQLFRELELGTSQWYRYDPAIPALSTIDIEHVDFLVNTDVMEHIPETDVDDVLKHMAALATNAFFNISTRLAREILPSGENAHCTVWSAERWLAKIREFFPGARLAYVYPEYSCTIVTWDSAIASVISAIEQFKQAIGQQKRDGPLKKIERKFRRLRDKVLGR